MAEAQIPLRMAYPSPSQFSGEALAYMTRLVRALNELPTFSYYSGNPTSALTANVGTVVVNVASAATARLWVKVYGSSNTGWASAATA